MIMNKNEIISQIEKRINNSRGSLFSDWYIGTTDNIEETKKKFGYPKFWFDFETDKNDVKEILDYFHNKHMKKSEASMTEGKYIYIF